MHSRRCVGDRSTSEREQVALKYLFLIPNPTIMAEEIEELAKQAVKIAEKLPEKFQEKAFEAVFNALLIGQLPAQPTPSGEGTTKVAAQPSKTFVVPLGVRAFMQQYAVPEESLPKLFLMQGNEVVPTYKLQTTKKAEAQTQIAVMTALENALRGGKFEFSTEDVRKRCDDHRCYDKANFAATFKKRTDLFKSLSDPEHIELSPDGKAELAETIMEMAK